MLQEALKSLPHQLHHEVQSVQGILWVLWVLLNQDTLARQQVPGRLSHPLCLFCLCAPAAQVPLRIPARPPLQDFHAPLYIPLDPSLQGTLVALALRLSKETRLSLAGLGVQANPGVQDNRFSLVPLSDLACHECQESPGVRAPLEVRMALGVPSA